MKRENKKGRGDRGGGGGVEGERRVMRELVKSQKEGKAEEEW